MLKEKRIEKYSFTCYLITVALIVATLVLWIFKSVEYHSVAFEGDYTGYRLLAVPFLPEEIAKGMGGETFYQAAYYCVSSYCYIITAVFMVFELLTVLLGFLSLKQTSFKKSLIALDVELTIHMIVMSIGTVFLLTKFLEQLQYGTTFVFGPAPFILLGVTVIAYVAFKIVCKKSPYKV